MHSALYTGWVRHRRFGPRPHRFSYRLFMLYLDLDEIDDAFHGRWLWSARRPALAWWRRADYLGDARLPLREAVAELVQRETGTRPAGPIRMLTHLRYFGFCFNPVTFYYCFDRSGSRLETIVAEITNTPWNERHAYVLGEPMNQGRGPARRYRFDKSFHVSPFIGMAVTYDWRFTDPGEMLAVHMRDLQGGDSSAEESTATTLREGQSGSAGSRTGAGHDARLLFDATLRLERRPLTAPNLATALCLFPLMTLKVIVAIYWQALRLWIRRTPFHAHPAPRATGHAGQQEITP